MKYILIAILILIVSCTDNPVEDKKIKDNYEIVVIDSCEYIWPDCGIIDGCCGPECTFSDDGDCLEPETELCWEAENEYLYRNRNQAKKFCKCAQGDYGYLSYSYFWGRGTVYRYIDSGDNENWVVSSRSSYLPITSVKCLDGMSYSTNQDYYYPN